MNKPKKKPVVIETLKKVYPAIKSHEGLHAKIGPSLDACKLKICGPPKGRPLGHFDVATREKIQQLCWEYDVAVGQNLRYLFCRDYHLFKRLFWVTGGTGFWPIAMSAIYVFLAWWMVCFISKPERTSSQGASGVFIRGRHGAISSKQCKDSQGGFGMFFSAFFPWSGSFRSLITLHFSKHVGKM